MSDFQSALFALVSDLSGMYVRAGMTQRTLLAACSGQASTWEAFKIEKASSDDRVWIRSAYNGKYVRALADPNNTLAAVGDARDQNSTFHLIDAGLGKVALQLDGRYVRAGIGEYSYLGACSNHLKGWETFRLQPTEMGELVTVNWCYSIDSRTGPIVWIVFNALVKNNSGFPWISSKVGVTRQTLISFGEIWQFNNREVRSFAGLSAGHRVWREIGRVPWFPYKSGNNKLVEYFVTYDFAHPDDVDKGNNSIQFFVTNKEIEEGEHSVNLCRPMPEPGGG